MALKSGQNIDVAFMAAMRSIGGKRPAEIDPSCEKTKNADLVFEADNVVAEVKTLLEDPREGQNSAAKLAEMYGQWVRLGKVPPQTGRVKIATDKLPPDCAKEFMLYLTRRIKSTVRKANQQIKATKASLGMPDAAGLMVLCNSGNSFMRPDMLLWGLHHALGKHHSSIDWTIYMTCGLPVHVPGVPEPVDLFTQPTRQGYEPMPSLLFDRIKGAWMTCVAGKTFTRVYNGRDAGVLFGVEHKRLWRD